jgi:hypothetical protein
MAIRRSGGRRSASRHTSSRSCLDYRRALPWQRSPRPRSTCRLQLALEGQYVRREPQESPPAVALLGRCCAAGALVHLVRLVGGAPAFAQCRDRKRPGRPRTFPAGGETAPGSASRATTSRLRTKRQPVVHRHGHQGRHNRGTDDHHQPRADVRPDDTSREDPPAGATHPPASTSSTSTRHQLRAKRPRAPATTNATTDPATRTTAPRLTTAGHSERRVRWPPARSYPTPLGLRLLIWPVTLMVGSASTKPRWQSGFHA